MMKSAMLVKSDGWKTREDGDVFLAGRSAFYVDDDWISGHLGRKNVSIMIVPSPEPLMIRLKARGGGEEKEEEKDEVEEEEEEEEEQEEQEEEEEATSCSGIYPSQESQASALNVGDKVYFQLEAQGQVLLAETIQARA
eukprot:605851-Hanusia_phi.AAC.1